MSNLALDLRPDSLGSVLGNEQAKKAIASFAEKDNWPNVFLLYGPPGTGKTTLALIIAKMCGAEQDGLIEINASDSNGVDAARTLSEISASRPFCGQRRVIILNEAHQLTPQAQNALKDPMEKNETIWILTTDRPEKIEPAIKSRAAAATFEIKPLSQENVRQLLQKANPGTENVNENLRISDFLFEHEVRSPREILGVLDQYLAVVPLEDAIHGSEHEPLYAEVARSVLSGNWGKTSEFLSKIKTADSRALTSVLSSFLRSALVRSPLGSRGDALASCLVGLDNSGYQDGTAYGNVTGLLYKCCKVLSRGEVDSGRGPYKI
jgi:replication-associated recombination protein RarA